MLYIVLRFVLVLSRSLSFSLSLSLFLFLFLTLSISVVPSNYANVLTQVSVSNINVKVCLTEFDFVIDTAKIEKLLFEKLLQNNYYVEFLEKLGTQIDEFLGAGKDSVQKTLNAVSKIVEKMKQPLMDVGGNLNNVKTALSNTLNALGPNALSFIPDIGPDKIKAIMEELVPGYKLGRRRLSEAEAEVATSHFMQRRTLKLLHAMTEREQQRLHERVAALHPETHRRMLLSFDASWLTEVFAALPEIKVRLSVSAGLDLKATAKEAFQAEGDLFDLEAIRRLIGDELPFEQDVEVGLIFPGLRAKFRVSLDVRMPWAVHAEANAAAKIAFEYDREQVLSSGPYSRIQLLCMAASAGLFRERQQDAPTSIDSRICVLLSCRFEVILSGDPSASELPGGVRRVTPSFASDVEVHAAVGLTIRSLEASAQLCFFSFCGGIFLKAKMSLFWAGFDAWASADNAPTTAGVKLKNNFSGYVYETPSAADEQAVAGQFFSAVHFVVAKRARRLNHCRTKRSNQKSRAAKG